MKISPSKENILKKIRLALIHSTPIPFPKSEKLHEVFSPAKQELEIEFAEQFNKLQGRFVFCVNRQELAFQLNSLIKKQGWEKVYCIEPTIQQMLGMHMEDEDAAVNLSTCDVSLTGCEYLIARTGSIVMSSAQLSGRNTSVYAPIHICIAFSNQLVYDIKEGLQLLKKKYGEKLPSFITLATGPSRTADIEKTLVVGVHGPKQVYCFLVDE